MPQQVISIPDELVISERDEEWDVNKRELLSLKGLLSRHGLIDYGGGPPVVEDRSDEKVQLAQELGTWRWIEWDPWPVTKSGTAYLKVLVPEGDIETWEDFLACVAIGGIVSTALYVAATAATVGLSAVSAGTIVSILLSVALACMAKAGLVPEDIEEAQWELEVVPGEAGGGGGGGGGGATPDPWSGGPVRPR